LEGDSIERVRMTSKGLGEWRTWGLEDLGNGGLGEWRTWGMEDLGNGGLGD
jgi:hypothetical protein